ncbi:helix-turn-helix domain-containing protein [Streptomyces syringium]|uniref:helix-turn-helix domain-containing protein n=1 Tax=Streptomyces syringium TaxID=76729 RepID=UPI0034138329
MIVHVAAEAGVTRACPSQWKNRYDTYGEAGLRDRRASHTPLDGRLASGFALKVADS